MSESDDWSWVEGLPESWPIPSDIAEPTSVPAMNLVIRIIEKGSVGNDAMEYVGRFLSEYSKVNSWVGGDGKDELSMQEIAALSSVLQNSVKRIYEAWAPYIARHEESGRMAGGAEDERVLFIGTLRDVVETLQRHQARA